MLRVQILKNVQMIFICTVPLLPQACCAKMIRYRLLKPRPTSLCVLFTSFRLYFRVFPTHLYVYTRFSNLFCHLFIMTSPKFIYTEVGLASYWTHAPVTKSCQTHDASDTQIYTLKASNQIRRLVGLAHQTIDSKTQEFKLTTKTLKETKIQIVREPNLDQLVQEPNRALAP